MRTEPLIRPEEIRDGGPVPTSPVTEPRRRMAVALGITIALLVAATGVAIWQATEASRRADEIASLTVARDEAVARGTALSDRVGVLDARVDRLSERLAAATGDEAELAAQLDDARAELERMVGPALPDGRHFAFLTAVGATQEPPRLVIDVAQWFTDDEAVAAAIEDGRLPPGSTSIENGYYIRNADPRWRMLSVDPTATVALVVYPFGDIGDPHVVSFDRFGELFAENPHGAIRGFPYWVTVEDGTVTAVEQQFIP
jgi:hypothetical protein